MGRQLNKLTPTQFGYPYLISVMETHRNPEVLDILGATVHSDPKDEKS